MDSFGKEETRKANTVNNAQGSTLVNIASDFDSFL